MRSVGLLLLTMVLPATSLAAPPTLTSLFPGGGQRGTTVEVTATGTFERWPVRVWVEGKGVTVEAAREKGRLRVQIAADAATGPRWLRLVDEQGASLPRRFLVGALPEVTEREPNDELPTAQPITGNVVVNGRLLRAGDVDNFAVLLKKGQTLVASLEANRLLGSPLDGVLQLVDAGGFVRRQSNDHNGLDPQLTYQAQADETLMVRVFAFPATPDASIRFAGGDNYHYRLTLTTADFVEHAWPLAVESGKEQEVTLVGWNLSSPIRKLTPTTDEAELSLDIGNAAGQATVRLEPHLCSIYSPPGDGKPRLLALPETVTGRLGEPGERHLYSFTAKKGQRLLFQIEAATLGFPVDAGLRVRDAVGKVLSESASNQLGRDPELLFNASQDGMYQLELRDVRGGGGSRACYRLRAMPAVPDFRLVLANDRLIVEPGKTLEVKPTLTRLHGFSGEVELRLEGLPAGIEVESKAGVLRLKAAANATGGGAVRLVGVPVGKAGPIRRGQATLGELGSTEWLWLNVGGEAPAAPRKKKRGG